MRAYAAWGAWADIANEMAVCTAGDRIGTSLAGVVSQCRLVCEMVWVEAGPGVAQVRYMVCRRVPVCCDECDLVEEGGGLPGGTGTMGGNLR